MTAIAGIPMNKAFVREPDQTAEYCPRCGTKGETVGSRTMAAYALKNRVKQDGVAIADPPEKGAAATFLELAPPPSAGACECTLDLENASGAKMRVQLKSITTPDLAALSQSFWNHQP